MSAWIKYGKSWREFRDADLVVSGTIIVIKSHVKYELLIGDINELGGVCDDCKHEALTGRAEPIVVEYKPPVKS